MLKNLLLFSDCRTKVLTETMVTIFEVIAQALLYQSYFIKRLQFKFYNILLTVNIVRASRTSSALLHDSV